MLNEELAVEAVRRALKDRDLPLESVQMLATGTTQGDLLVPGFASMVHGRLGGAEMELLAAGGGCAARPGARAGAGRGGRRRAGGERARGGGGVGGPGRRAGAAGGGGRARCRGVRTP